MGFWGWRPLAIAVFVCVWVSGCNIVSDASPRTSPTPSPRVTLTVRRIATATATPSPRAIARPTIPAPTPEPPAASATPVTYIVADGDTFGDIALRFNVDVTLLREANGNIDPRTLQPGQILIIPVTGTVLRPPTATSIPPQLALPDPACYETTGGTLLCLGLVENTLDAGLEQVEVLVQVFNQAESLIAENAVDVEQTFILPGAGGPYRAYFDIDADDADRVQATLLRADRAAELDTRFVTVDVEDTAVEVQTGRTMVSATLHNRTSTDAVSVRAIVMLKDPAGHVIGYRVSPVASRLAAGDSVNMRLAIVAQIPVGNPQVEISVEARRAE